MKSIDGISFKVQTMLNAQQLRQYSDAGYIIFHDLFTSAEMDALDALIEPFDRAHNEELQRRRTTGGSNDVADQIVFTGLINQRSHELQAFAADQRFVDITTALLGPDIRLYYDQSVYKRPEARRDFPWHQDNGYTPTDPIHYVTCWLAVSDASVANGCVWIKPETHKLGVVEHTQTPIGWQCYFGDDPGVPVELTRGSMVVFQSLLFHRSGPNTSSDTRKAYVLQYSVDRMRHAVTGKMFHNGPVIARDGQAAYDGFDSMSLEKTGEKPSFRRGE